MTKIKISEIFYSLQGEGRFIGVPSVFWRTFGCNFTCSGFGMPAGEKSTERNSVVAEQYSKFEDLPLVSTGCDSYASWDPRFKHLSPVLGIDAIADGLTRLTPNNRWVQKNGNDVHLVITGGEPLLGWQRCYPDLLDHELMQDLENITFETNGTQPLHHEFKEYLSFWNSVGRDVTFSVSPKINASGESWGEAVQPKIVARYQDVGHVYLKFVVSNPGHFEDVDRAVEEYRHHGFGGDIYVMPVGGVVDVYDGNKFSVAEEALKRGYRYSPRLHVDLWGNGWSR